MAYDEELAERVRDLVGGHPAYDEKKMFGGLCVLIGGNMAVGIVGDELMVRVGKDAHEAALARPHARPMDFTNRPMAGFVYVAAEGVADDDGLRDWVDLGVDFAESLPPK